jgi:hypothetical protein
VPIINVQLGGVPPGQPIPNPPPNPAAELSGRGPCLPVSILPYSVILQQLVLQGTALPTPITGFALIDTGSGVTCIDIDAATHLKVPIIDYSNLTSATHANQNQPVYPVQIQIPGSAIGINAPRAIGVPLASQGIIALIGRDVLKDSILIYNGPAGQFSFTV